MGTDAGAYGELKIYHLGMGVVSCQAEGQKAYLVKYSPQALPLVWPTIQPWLEKTLSEAPPWWRLSDIHERCLNGDLIAWVACIGDKAYGMLLTGIEQYHEAKVCGVPWIGGSKMPAWIGAAQYIIESWAKAAGCTHLSGGGREGWARVANMKNYGPILSKDL